MGESLAILKDFVASGVLEFADESYTRARLPVAPEEPTPEIPDNPPPDGDMDH